MESKVIQEFKAEINGVEITNQDIYWEVDYILGDIECVLDMELPTRFIKDFIEAYTEIYNSLDSEYLYEFKSDMVFSWDREIKDIKELNFNLPYGYRSDKLNKINERIPKWNRTYGRKTKK
nr:MAG TPA: hypothetical protein [Caudoviricetes sp.]